MSRRVVALVAALAVALLGTMLVFSVARGGPAEAVLSEEQTQVLVATQLIPAGTTGRQLAEQGLAQLVDYPVRLVPTGALLDIVPVQQDELGADVQPGEVLVQSRFVSSRLAGTIEIPEDKMAVTISVAEAQRVAGFVKPGLDVAVFQTYPVTAPAENLEMPPGVTWPEGAAKPVVDQATRVLIPRVKVIAVGPTAYETVGAPATDPNVNAADAAGLVTLAVSVEDAQRLAHASQTGQLTLGLLSEASRTTSVRPADDTRTLF